MCDHSLLTKAKYSPKLHFGTSNSDKVTGISTSRMLADRQARMRQIMTENSIASILLTGAENVRYLTGFWWSEFQRGVGYALFFADHDPVVFAPAGALQQMPDLVPGITEWRPAISWMDGVATSDASHAQAKRFAAQVFAELRDRGLDSEP